MAPDEPFQITCRDAKLWLRTLLPGSADLIITDPPYSSLEKHRNRGSKARLGGGKRTNRPWFPVVPNDYFPELFEIMYGVLKPNRHCYVFCDFETMLWLVDCARKAGFTVHKPLVWNKMHFGMGYHYRAQYEFILFMSKGKRMLNDRGVADVLSVRKLYGAGAAEKPFDLVDTFVRQSTNPGELVVDPFVGSGVTGEAAIHRECRFLGNDIEQETADKAQKRLSDFIDPFKIWQCDDGSKS